MKNTTSKFIYETALGENKKSIKSICVEKDCFISMSFGESENNNWLETDLLFEYKKGNTCVSFEPRFGMINIYRLLPNGHRDICSDGVHHLLGEYNYFMWFMLEDELEDVKDEILKNNHDEIFKILKKFYNFK